MQDLNLMLIFAEVIEAGSFSGAAQQLGVSRSAISKAVANLEKGLGARLLNRSTRHLSATEVGVAFFEHCQRIKQETEAAQQVVDSLNAVPRGTLRVAASVAFGTLHIAPALSDFLNRYPEIDMDMTIIDRPVDMAEEGYDVVIRVCETPPENRVARNIAPAGSKLCATPDYFKRFGIPKRPEDLEHHNCLDYIHSGDKGMWRFTGPTGEIAVPVSGRLRINDDDALSQAVLSGLGLALLPTFLIGKDLQAGRLQAVLSKYIPIKRHIYAIHMPTRHLPLKIRVFVDFLAERFGPRPYWDRV
ncbi:MAG: LysR family transcriptional regulator [Methylobacillus sp.]|jgi:DNA-binding transcriptional LysR family regulator|nr:LysR family transcriptional regulator [Methylobacillus sp.]